MWLKCGGKCWKQATQMCPCTKRTAWNDSFLIYQKSIAFARSVPCFGQLTNETRKFVITRPLSGVGMGEDLE